MSNTKSTDYYARLGDCLECHASRGVRCSENGRIRQDPHSSRIISSGVQSKKGFDNTLVECPTCRAGVGMSCRSGTFRTRMSRPHASRRKALEEAKAVSDEQE